MLSVLTHFNYWSGNILWAGRQIAAIIDWEEVGCGDPAVGIAYCRMDMILQGFSDAADKFVNTCQTLSGYDVAIFFAFLGNWHPPCVQWFLHQDGSTSRQQKNDIHSF